MDILANFSVDLTQDQITEIITEAVEKQANRKVTKVHWDITGASYSMDPRESSTGASVKIRVDLGTDISGVQK